MEAHATTILAATCVALGVLYVLKRVLGARQPGLPVVYREFPYLPWLGSVYQFATGPRSFLQRATDACGEIFTINLFGTPLTFLMGSEGHDLFFKTNDEIFDIRQAYRCTVVTFGPHVVYDCSQKVMSQQLAFFKNGLLDENYPHYVELITEEFENYFQAHWGDAGEKCLFTALSEVFTLTSARCLLGPELRAAWSGEFAEFYRDLDHSFIPITFFFPNMPHPYRSRCVRARQMFEQMFQKIIAERRLKKEQHDDFLQVLMEANYKSGEPLTIQEITGIMVATLLGGQHTSNVTGTWALLHLMLAPQWRDACLAEQQALLGSRLDQPLRYDNVKEMAVFDRVINETLRLHPPFFQLSRVVTEDTPFKGHIIPRGHWVSVSPGAAQRSPELWGPGADEFDPQRWTDDAVALHKKYSWIPFGGGRHQCSGRKFATTSLKTGLAWLLRNYELEFAPGVLPREDYTTMVVAPQAPVLVKYRRIAGRV